MRPLLAELVRGAAETVRETLPGDADERRCFLGGFALGFSVQMVAFTLLSLLGPH